MTDLTNLWFVYYPKRSFANWVPYKEKEFAVEYEEDWRKIFGSGQILNYDQAIKCGLPLEELEKAISSEGISLERPTYQ